MYLDSQGLNVVRTISSSCEIGQVELNLVPALIESHRHGTDEWLHSCSRLIIRSSESSSNVFIIKDLDFEGEVFFQVLYNHDQEWQLNTQCLFGISWGSDVVGADVSSHDFQYA